MDIQISYYSDRGRRSRNEDSVSLLEGRTGVLAIVADGLGGHADGELASKTAVSTINGLLQSVEPDREKLIGAIRQAAWAIQAAQQGSSGMYTTAAVLWLGESGALAAHVGDSRIYQFRKGKLLFQTLDHSLAQSAVLLGELEPEELRTSRDRNKLFRVLGDGTEPKIDCRTLEVQPGDRFLVCSDGFWECVTEAQMLETLGKTDTPSQWLEAMREQVFRKSNPRQDNHTAIVIEFGIKA